MKARTIIIAGVLAVGGLAAITIHKVMTLKAVFDRMKITPSAIKDFKLTLTEVSFKLNFKITNPTTEEFSVSGASMATLKSVSVYRSGNFFGSAWVNLNEIIIPAQSTVELQNLQFNISLQSLLENLSTIDKISLAELRIEAVVEVLGRDYIIEG